ncbi:MAG: amidohydrolase family protein [Hespellia sp.]|nr:amidohydrolase family protein [Hespellia sp.]
MCKLYADYVLLSDNIFTGIDDTPFKGYVATADHKIIQVGQDDQYQSLIGEHTQIFDFKERLITPGFIDVHTFFTGYAIFHIGMDVSTITSVNECMECLQDYAMNRTPESTLFGHGWNPEQLSLSETEERLNQNYTDRAVILFAADRGSCIMNQKAKEMYGFSTEECYPEAYHKIMREYLNDRTFIEAEFNDYMKLMNSRGVTTVKEMGFDDFYGFTDFLKEKETELSLRFFFMSQPVGEGANIAYGKEMSEKFTGDFVRFSGYNRMTDGTVASTRGDLLEPYEGTDSYCNMEIDYGLIEKELQKADQNGFRYSLHAQGDGAVHKVVEMYDRCKKEKGKLVNRHAITDMEFSNPKDLEKMGELGVIGEIYFQIMSLDSGDEVKEAIRKTIGMERGKYYWNRRKMLDSGVLLSGATDLPLMITDIPEAIYHGCGGHFPEGGEPFNKQNTISVSEMLKAWTYGGAFNIGMEDKLGTLEEGKLADIAVLDRNVFQVSMEEMRNVKIAMTMVNGEIAYNRDERERNENGKDEKI